MSNVHGWSFKLQLTIIQHSAHLSLRHTCEFITDMKSHWWKQSPPPSSKRIDCLPGQAWRTGGRGEAHNAQQDPRGSLEGRGGAGHHERPQRQHGLQQEELGEGSVAGAVEDTDTKFRQGETVLCLHSRLRVARFRLLEAKTTKFGPFWMVGLEILKNLLSSRPF